MHRLISYPGTAHYKSSTFNNTYTSVMYKDDN